ncbi:amidohydrolase [Clostridium thermosuccinogenes]|jgi:predicted TIM-barrel fold metal-dependent hydrolase|uniref:Amidohydrolase n=1 Tax=Clostridium thermosuccinogenes TaxID=84032 RepID=A0A2K2FMF5_9CLOT|nr:amidohydrolase family protein [Pseudoclostridium thermosuccinogenes]AUS95670.1 amidohydrolase [Pseudoclostridium thermosuccinogenes]PNT99967.1 amidohydrolase [Pseudoclostridium thermosuccinogenes]PNU01412.1 amidohydrolase [Pseudoclostridium thermosuccinogenes]
MTEHRKIIDVHAHVFPDKIADKAVGSIGEYYGVPMHGKGTASDLMESGSRINVSYYVVHSTATKVEQVKTINDFIAEQQRKNSCFIGFGTLHPDMEDVDEEVDRIISLGLKGIKLHPDFQDFCIDDERMMGIYEAVEKRLPVLLHMGDENKTSSSPKRLEKVLDRFPKLVVVAAHLGGYRMWKESMDCLVGRNVFFDTSSSLFWLDSSTAVSMIRKHGVNKVLFGSDYPMWSHEEELERFLNLGLTKEEREFILWRNAARLLNLG